MHAQKNVDTNGQDGSSAFQTRTYNKWDCIWRHLSCSLAPCRKV